MSANHVTSDSWSSTCSQLNFGHHCRNSYISGEVLALPLRSDHRCNCGCECKQDRIKLQVQNAGLWQF